MRESLTLSLGTLYGFLLVLARVGGALTFVPLPGVKSAPETARVALALGLTLALFSRWPEVDSSAVNPAVLAGWMVAEAAVGVAIGVAASVTLEVFAMAAQLLGVQAGFAYASTIDPNSEADSGILVVFAQLMAGAMFFAAGLDRDVVRLFARSLDAIPAGTWRFTTFSAQPLIGLGSALFAAGLRLALPIIALLAMVDLSLALLGRLNQQLQLLSLAFPIKMLAALLALSWVAYLFPRVLMEVAGLSWLAARQALGI